MLKYKSDDLFKIVIIISIISLISAYFIQFILGHQPCNLCLIERIPYALSIILIIFNYTFFKNEQFIILLLVLIFSFSFIISFYHFGIEQGYFDESAVCTLKSASDNITKEEILEQLQLNAVSCKDVTFRIFGFSLTTFNMILSLILVILLINLFKNYEKYQK